ncbi:P-loop containing nucleoside triphosphate hydrolase protein [Rhizophagus clarus]|uniref:P-loop containing nucleoside triphosphate hydrolase protein n=1 Tax=Rhizophagus clarus TaxID=94130 RepID=A0A8H3QW09_9GLOM|nr:P-loop containing nucleoside triphosphate hydrolase protein [Rhizophagus clarus]
MYQHIIEVGHGVVYVDVPTVINDFGEEFGKAINFVFERHGSNDNKSDSPKWVRALEAFLSAAEAYKVKYNRPAVIMLTDFSEGSVPIRMLRESSSSRLYYPPIEIGDLNKEESLDYLVNKRKIKLEEAGSLYELVSGRIIDLNVVANKSLAGQSLKDIKKSIIRKIRENFTIAQINPGQKYHKVSCKIINSLLETKELELKTYKRIFDNEDDADKILEKNVFACHPGDGVITFQSQSVELYIKNNANDFGVKLIDYTIADEDYATPSNQMDNTTQMKSPPIHLSRNSSHKIAFTA